MKVTANPAGVLNRFLLPIFLLSATLLAGCAGLVDFGPQSPSAPLRSDRLPLPDERTGVVGALQVTSTQYTDTLPDIARRYSLGYEEMVSANPGVDPWLPGEGTEVVLPTAFVLPAVPREGLVLNLATMRLYYFPEPVPGEAAEVVTYPIGIGREGWETPLGKLRIIQKKEQPSWTVPASIRREHAEQGDPLPAVVPPGPDNPLGAYAMRLSNPSYLIHGTNQPWGVGMRVSHGCVRLYPEDIARLFPEVPVNTPVSIINEPFLVGWRGGQLYLEAHPPLSEDGRTEEDAIALAARALEAVAGNRLALDQEKVLSVAREAKGVPIPVLVGSARWEQLLSSLPRVTSTPPWAPETYDEEEVAVAEEAGN